MKLGFFQIAFVTLSLLLSLQKVSLADPCSSAQGTPLSASGMHQCYCKALGTTIDPLNPSDASRCSTKTFTTTLSGVNGIANNCIQQPKSCGHSLINSEIADDKKSSIFNVIGSSQSTCQAKGAYSALSRVNPNDLENSFSAQPNFNIADTANTVTNCFHDANPSDQKQAISKYFYLSNRIKNADLISLQAYASINSLLGKPLLNGLPDDKCKDYLSKERSDACDFYAKNGGCQSAGGLDDLVHKTQDVLKEVDAIDARLNKLNHGDVSDLFPDRAPSSMFNINVPIQKLTDEKATLLSMFPWIQGDAYKKADKYYQTHHLDGNSEGAIRDKIQKQLIENQADLAKRLDRLRQANSCLNKESDFTNGLCKTFSETIDETPDLPEKLLNTNVAKDLLVNDSLNEAKCSYNHNEEKKQLNDLIKKNVEVTVGAIAIAAVTGGTGEIAFLSGVGGLASAGLDAGFAVSSGVDVFKGCRKDLYQVDTLKAGSSYSPMSCPMNPAQDVQGIPNVTSDLQACVVHAVAGSLNVIPVLKYAKFAQGGKLVQDVDLLTDDTKLASRSEKIKPGSVAPHAPEVTPKVNGAAGGALDAGSASDRALSRTISSLEKEAPSIRYKTSEIMPTITTSDTKLLVGSGAGSQERFYDSLKNTSVDEYSSELNNLGAKRLQAETYLSELNSSIKDEKASLENLKKSIQEDTASGKNPDLVRARTQELAAREKELKAQEAIYAKAHDEAGKLSSKVAEIGQLRQLKAYLDSGAIEIKKVYASGHETNILTGQKDAADASLVSVEIEFKKPVELCRGFASGKNPLQGQYYSGCAAVNYVTSATEKSLQALPKGNDLDSIVRVVAPPGTKAIISGIGPQAASETFEAGLGGTFQFQILPTGKVGKYNTYLTGDRIVRQVKFVKSDLPEVRNFQKDVRNVLTTHDLSAAHDSLTQVQDTLAQKAKAAEDALKQLKPPVPTNDTYIDAEAKRLYENQKANLEAQALNYTKDFGTLSGEYNEVKIRVDLINNQHIPPEQAIVIANRKVLNADKAVNEAIEAAEKAGKPFDQSALAKVYNDALEQPVILDPKNFPDVSKTANAPGRLLRTPASQ